MCFPWISFTCLLGVLAGFLLAKDIFNWFQQVICYALNIDSLAMDRGYIYLSAPLQTPTGEFFGEPVVEEFKKNVQVMRCFLS